MASISTEFMVEAIIASASGVVTTMIGADAAPCEAALDSTMASGDDSVIALIGIAGDWSGTGSLSCSAKLACRLSGGLLMTEFAAVDDEVLDAIGEIANMIIGNIKNALEIHAGQLALSIPTVVYGKNFVTRSMSKRQCVSVPFQIGDEKLAVQISIEEQTESRIRAAGSVDRLTIGHG